MLARNDPRETSKAGRDAAWQRFLDRVDPDRILPEAERDRRAEAARRAHMSSIALKSVRARAAKRAGRSRGTASGEAEQDVDLVRLPLLGDDPEGRGAVPLAGAHLDAFQEQSPEVGLERGLSSVPGGLGSGGQRLRGVSSSHVSDGSAPTYMHARRPTDTGPLAASPAWEPARARPRSLPSVSGSRPGRHP